MVTLNLAVMNWNNEHWLINSEVLWYSSEGNFIGNSLYIITVCCKITHLKSLPYFSAFSPIWKKNIPWWHHDRNTISTIHWWTYSHRTSDVELWCFIVGLNKLLNKQCQWFEKPWRSWTWTVIAINLRAVIIYQWNIFNNAWKLRLDNIINTDSEVLVPSNNY